MKVAPGFHCEAETFATYERYRFCPAAVRQQAALGATTAVVLLVRDGADPDAVDSRHHESFCPEPCAML
jgi:hypothetical protein